MNDYLSPDEIAGASFETKRRGGLDPESVRSHLRAAAETVASLIDERDGLLAQLQSAQTSLESAPEPSAIAEPVELDEDALTEQLGQHAARVLAEARSAAADRIAEAEAEAEEIRAAAEELHEQRSIAADTQAQTIRNDAERLRTTREAEANEAAASILAQAESDAEVLRSASSLSRDEAGHDAERIIRDAEVTRRQILEDLARRRTAARRQIEQLRAGRERLMATHETMRRALDEITEELTISMSEARAAAETAGHTVPETTIEELEAEIETARLSGLLDTGPVPVVNESSDSSSTNKALQSKAIPTSVQPESHKGETASSETAEDNQDQETSEPETSDDADEAVASEDVDADMDETTEGAEEPALVEVEAEAEAEETDEVEEGQASSTDETLAPVVSLDQARSEVETRGHPAAGREASSTRPEIVPSPEVETEQFEVADASVAEAVTEDVSSDDDDSVDALFASLRSETAVEDSEVENSDADEDGEDDQSVSDEVAEADEGSSGDDSADAEIGDASTMDGPGGARRIKRVLADEQSRVMSTLKSSDDMASLDDLLGTSSDQVDQYWSASGVHLGGGDGAPEPIHALVKAIRRKVSDALESAGDTDTAVESMRSVYREIKTSAVEECVEAIVDGSTSAAS